MKNFLLTIALAVLAILGASTQASAQAPANVQAVDLGLPSGIRWASCNVGATTPEDFGNYYAWGETETKADYSWATYKHANGEYNKLTKYCTDASYGDNGFTDNKTVLDSEDDAAHVNWGEGWRMPTDAEWTELREQCTWTWTTQNGVNGYQVTSKTNSNSIFLPAAGYRDGADLGSAGSRGHFLSASLRTDGSDYAWSLYFNSDYVYRYGNDRSYGFSVRPVGDTTPANVQATQGDTTGVTVTWDAVPDAVGYEITAESWDVAINQTVRTKTTNGTQLRDTLPVRPALGRYTVKAVFADGTKSKASEPAIGYSVLETMRLLGISTRWPWNGKVDIDVEYNTVRYRFQELFGLPDLPFPANVTLTARTADGKLLPIRTLEKESAINRITYTLNRQVVQNGTALFTGSGELRLVWDADTDTLGIHAPGTTITLTASDTYARTTDSATVDVNTTKPEFIFLTEKDTVVSLPWAARWADEASRSLNMQDGTDVKFYVNSYHYPEDSVLLEEQTQLSDECGVFDWKSVYGVAIVLALDSNRATAAKTVYKSKFFRYVMKNPVSVEQYKQKTALDIWWTGSGDCTYYQVIRREVYRDGTRSNWGYMAPVSTYSDGHPDAGRGRYIDIISVGGKTYEYAVLPKYFDPDTHDAITAPVTDSTFWGAGRVPIGITLDVQSVGQNSIALTWTDVPDAYTYDIYRDNGDGQYQKITNVPYTATTFTDTRAETGKRYIYKVSAFNYKGDTLETSNPVDAYSQLDALYLHNLQPRFPWNGLVDIFVGYRSARDMQQDGTPHFRVVATSGNDTLAIKTLTLAAATLDPNDFTLPADGTSQRLVWDARTDLGATYFPKGLILTVSCTRVEPYQEAATTKPFEGGYANGGFVPLDLRRTPEVQLGIPTTVFADLGWFEGASRLEVVVNGTSVFSTTDENNDSFALGKEQLTIWGVNILKLKSDNGIEQTAQIKYPDFVFTATQGNRDSIIVEWNSLYDVQAYSIRRRAANTEDAFAEVALVGDTTRWADTSEETFIGEFEYTIMPLLAHGEEAGSQPAAVIGYRAQDIARPITIMPTENGTATTDKPTARYGETVTLTITPATGYEYEKLSVTDGKAEVPVVMTAEGLYIFTMPLDEVKVSATFKAINYTVTTASVENGTLTADKQEAHYTDEVVLTVVPATGYELDKLTVKNGEAEVLVSESNTFIMPANDVQVTATFKAIDYTVITASAKNGSVTADKKEAHYKDMVVLTVVPATGYELDKLTVKAGDTEVKTTETADGNYTFTMPAGDVAISATFRMAEYTVTLVHPATGGGIISDRETAFYGDIITLTVTQAVGYEFVQLRVMDGETAVNVVKTAEGTYTFTMPANNVTVSATFKAIDYSVTLKLAGSGSAIASKSIAHYGDMVVVTATPAAGYELGELLVLNSETEIDVEETAENKYTFSMPAGNVIISVSFMRISTDIEDTPAINTADSSAPRKVFRNGIVYIIRDGKTYTLAGDEVQVAF